MSAAALTLLASLAPRCLGGGFQDPELEAALKADRARIAAKRPLTDDEKRAYVAPKAGVPAKPRASCTIAIVPLEFADAKRGSRDLERELARLADFTKAMSGGAFTLSWKVRAAASIDAKRGDFARLAAGSREEKKPLEALAVDGADAVVFVAAGPFGARGTALWPHKDALELSDRTLDYLIVPEEAEAHWLGILAHEFGHVLGLEDKYEDASAKVGRWCLMGTGYLGDKADNPMPLCGVCRERLGWASAGLIDARKGAAVSLGAGDLVRIPVVEGKEALVLEMRDRLIVWHTGGGKAIERVPVEGDRLTPYSDPPFLGRTLGSSPVWLTDVRVEGGRAYVRVALSGEPTPLEELRRSRVGKPLGK